MATISREVSKAHNIRDIVGKTLTNEAAHLIGETIAVKAAARNIGKITLGRGGRVSDPELMEHIQRGFTGSGIDVLNAGMVTIPMLCYATINECGGSGVVIAGSHSPPGRNGFKMMFGDDTLVGPVIQELLTTIEADRFTQPVTKGGVTEKDISVKCCNYIVGHVKLKRPMKIIIDADNGVGDAFASALYCALDNEVTELFSEVDGTFPHHHPNPSKPRNLQNLIATLKNSDTKIGLVLDDNANHLGVVIKDGNIACPDRQLVLSPQDVLSHNPGARVIFDIRPTRLLAPWIKGHGGESIMEKAGHSFIKSTMKKTGVLIADKVSGHVFSKERWFDFDDGVYAGVCLLEILSTFDNPTEMLDNLSQGISTPEFNIDLPEGSNGHQVIEELVAKAKFEGAAEIVTIDGLHIEFPDGFDLMYASNATSILVLRFEADSDEVIERIQNQFEAVTRNNPTLKWPL